MAGFHGHDDFFEGGIAGAFADAVDGAFDLAGAALNAGEGVGDGEAEVVVAVGGEEDILGAGDVGDEVFEHGAVFGGGGEADGVGAVDGGSAGFDGGVDDFGEVVEFGARGVFGGEFDIVNVGAGEGDVVAGHAENFIFGFFEFEFAMDFGGGAEDVDAAMRGVLDGFPGAADVFFGAAGEAGDDGVADFGRDGGDGIEVTGAGDGEAGFDDIDAEGFEGACDFEFFLEVHGGAGGLLAVTEGGVEDADGVGGGTGGGGLGGAHGGLLKVGRVSLRGL